MQEFLISLYCVVQLSHIFLIATFISYSYVYDVDNKHTKLYKW